MVTIPEACGPWFTVGFRGFQRWRVNGRDVHFLVKQGPEQHYVAAGIRNNPFNGKFALDLPVWQASVASD